MRKLILLIGVIAFTVMTPVVSSAKKQQKQKPTTTTVQQTTNATDSLKTIVDEAKKGNAKAQNELGRWYYMGLHDLKQNYTTAVEWWTKAAKQDNPEAIANLGLCYKTGHGVKADSLTAAKFYQNAIKKGFKQALAQNAEEAKKGDMFSIMLVADCYLQGIGVQKDPAKAVPYLEMAAKKNNVTAVRTLGMTYLNAKKFSDAAGWFKKGSSLGDVTSTYYYGKMLLDGQGVKQDKKDGVNYMLKAADSGLPQAMYVLGTCYMNGDGVNKSPEQAVKWYKQASGGGIAGAQWQLAQCYREGIGTDVNYNQALDRYAQAVAKGYGRSFQRLVTDTIPNSTFVDYLRGCKFYASKRFDDALNEFKKVEKAKLPDGKVMEGAVYINSDYSKQNLKKGVKLIKDAAKKDDVQAIYLLAGLYEAGKGVDKDAALALENYTKAADMGYGPAECALGDIYYEGRGVEQNYEKAVELYLKAYSQSQLTENAGKRLAACYEDGKGGLTVDKKEAEKVLKASGKNIVGELFKYVN
ncbi:MAG: sel1 repeat family protein [Paramuribaculum sp.]|nr:sel1 repeat family protein [Paramuribaculum sp.]